MQLQLLMGKMCMQINILFFIQFAAPPPSSHNTQVDITRLKNQFCFFVFSFRQLAHLFPPRQSQCTKVKTDDCMLSRGVLTASGLTVVKVTTAVTQDAPQRAHQRAHEVKLHLSYQKYINQELEVSWLHMLSFYFSVYKLQLYPISALESVYIIHASIMIIYKQSCCCFSHIAHLTKRQFSHWKSPKDF